MQTAEFAVLDSALMSYFIFGLVLCRMGAMVVMAPFFSGQQIPQRVKAAMAVFFSLCCFGSAGSNFSMPPDGVINSAQIVVMVLAEVMIGVTLGFLASAVFTAAQMAGQIVGQQIGFAMANVVDPFSNLQVSIVGYLLAQTVSLIFLVLNIHLGLIFVLCTSYNVVPPGILAFQPWMISCLDGFVFQTDLMFEAMLRIAMPIILITLMASVIIGFVSRTMPQMNIMVLGMPLRIVMGLLAVMFLIPGFCAEFAGSGFDSPWLFNDDNGLLARMLKGLAQTVADMAPHPGAAPPE